MGGRILIAENPRAGSGSAAERVTSLARSLEAHRFEVLRRNDPEGIRREIVDGQRSDSLAAVVAAGGDGTVSMIADWLSPSTPLAILPVGTENLLARHLGFDGDPTRLADRIVRGPRRPLDAGRANGKLFLVMASVGFDATVVDDLHRNRRGHIRHWSYFPPFFRALRQYRFPLLRIATDLRERPLEVRWAWIFNIPRYAIGLRFVPDADDHDGRLDLATFRDGGVLKGLVYFVGVVTGRHRRWSDWQVERAKRIEITSTAEVPYQLDGDPGGFLPLTIEVLPGRLTIIAPPDPAT
ncbi:MAG TPA: hypothetical protein DCQ98_16245 [Planctomycetaceae bacterium]|nr:hypothetical protein [Planctomycetaceae bacterium]HRF02672.1 diacylglycerol kinase family protein [Pirellulaceae bacterium]